MGFSAEPVSTKKPTRKFKTSKSEHPKVVNFTASLSILTKNISILVTNMEEWVDRYAEVISIAAA